MLLLASPIVSFHYFTVQLLCHIHLASLPWSRSHADVTSCYDIGCLARIWIHEGKCVKGMYKLIRLIRLIKNVILPVLFYVHGLDKDVTVVYTFPFTYWHNL